MKTLQLCSRIVQLVALIFIPLLAQAHPGHGLGPVGHDLQHALWNFLGMAVLAVALLAGDWVFNASLRISRIKLLHYTNKALRFLSRRNTKN